MKQALHVICHRADDGGWKNATPVWGERGLYRSIWNLTESQRDALQGGFVYFHESSRERSTFAGIVEECLSKNDGVVLFTRELVGVSAMRWRGKIKPSFHYPFGGLVEADYAHEAE
jgi:hypothetical protein